MGSGKPAASEMGTPAGLRESIASHLRMKDNHGIAEVTCDRWEYFASFQLLSEMTSGPLLCRGQRDPDWLLSSRFERTVHSQSTVLAKVTPEGIEGLRAMHLERFKRETRGRCGLARPEETEDKEWWALGGHFGLETPFLDWTESPFVAAYFAFVDPAPTRTGHRAIFMMNAQSIRTVSHRLPEGKRLEIIESASCENRRLISQRGAFTFSQDGRDIESWFRQHIPMGTMEDGLLVGMAKFVVPEGGRQEFLRALNKMNINHLTLFPDDLYGASKYCNLALTVSDY